MERLTDRYDGKAILICENEKCDKFDEIVCCLAAYPCEAEQNMIDRLAAYEDAEEQGLLVRVKDREVIRRALARYCHYLESELYERLTHGESNGVKELQKEIALVEAALKEG